MLALDDAALARLMIGATRLPANARSRWLQDLARKLDPPPRPLTRQARWRTRHRNGRAIYRLETPRPQAQSPPRARIADGATEAILLASHRDADSALICLSNQARSSGS
jgi:hypothetical protein